MFRKLITKLSGSSNTTDTGSSVGLEDVLDYQYDGLINPASIRICVLHRGSPGERVRCSLAAVDLDSEDEGYTALSYTWKDEQKTKYVLCDGYKIAVTAALYSALERLRKIKVRRVWADALCINQSTDQEALEERAQQVRVMHRVFSGATRVLVDLGEADRHTAQGLLFIKKLAQIPDSVEEHSGPPVPPKTLKYLAAWMMLMTRPWFRRVWVIQEFALAKQVDMMIGTEIVKAGAVVWAALMVGSRNKQLLIGALPGSAEEDFLNTSLAAQAMANIVVMVTVRDNLLKPRPERYESAYLAGLTRRFKSTDERDMIYALLGMASDGQEIAVDYSEPPDRLFYRVACHMIKKGHTFLVLSHAGGDAALSEVPSWVPYFSRNYGVYPLALELGERNYCAASSQRSSIQLLESVLRISGILYDVVATVSEARQEARSDERLNSQDPRVVFENQSALFIWLEKMIEFVNNGEKTTETQYTMLPALWRTLIGGRFQLSRDLSEASGFVRAVQDCRASLQFFSYYRMELESSEYEMTQVGAQKGWASKMMEALTQPALTYLAALDKTRNKRLCRTKLGSLGLVPKVAEPGDSVVLFLGSEMPHVLQKKRHNSGYRYLGNCYIDGIMDGEALEHNELEPVHIDIV